MIKQSRNIYTRNQVAFREINEAFSKEIKNMSKEARKREISLRAWKSERTQVSTKYGKAKYKGKLRSLII